MIQGSVFMVQGLGFRVQGLGLHRDWESVRVCMPDVARPAEKQQKSVKNCRIFFSLQNCRATMTGSMCRFACPILLALGCGSGFMVQSLWFRGEGFGFRVDRSGALMMLKT